MKNMIPKLSNGNAFTNVSSHQYNFTSRGIALVAVLAILTVLAILSAAFSILMNMEKKISSASIAKVQADSLARSGLEHAVSMLHQDTIEQPGWDYLNEPWSRRFRPSSKTKKLAVSVNGTTDLTKRKVLPDARWILVRNDSGKLIGRYAVLIEDESSKININVASALSPKKQNQGVGTSELMLTDGKGRGLPGVDQRLGRDILRYRYGNDLGPGHIKVDDNNTASQYGADEIDNNANGVVDEPDEGIDEPEEYNPLRLSFDDRSFISIREMVDKCLKKKVSNKKKNNFANVLKKYATVYSRGPDMYWDERNKKWRKQVNLNVASRRQVQKLIRRANSESSFESQGKNLRILTANLLDYRDENNVLTTLGSDYGVEGVCFNEIMANDGSFSKEPDQNRPDVRNKYEIVYHFGYWYNPFRYENGEHRYQQWSSRNEAEVYGWQLKSVGPFSLGNQREILDKGKKIKKPIVKITIDDNASDRLSRLPFYKEFKEILDTLKWPKDLWRNASFIIRYGKDDYATYPIYGNDNDNKTIYIGVDTEEDYEKLAEYVTDKKVARIETFWHKSYMMWSVFPEQSDYWVFSNKVVPEVTPRGNQYYYVFIGDQNFGSTIEDHGLEENGVPRIPNPYNDFYDDYEKPCKGFCETLDTDGKPSSYSSTEMSKLRKKDLKGSTLKIPQGQNEVWLLRTPYNKGKPVRSTSKGYIPVLLTSSRKCGTEIYDTTPKNNKNDVFKFKNSFDVVYVMRPDIIELINISDRPISLNNWRIVINTGSYADQVGVIENAVHYSQKRFGSAGNPNPSIEANGYFYLTNNRQIFDLEYGNPNNGTWGSGLQEKYPCYELPDFLWGTRYEVTSVSGGRIKVKGAQWRKDQMQLEMVEFHSSKSVPEDRNGVTGIRKSVRESGGNWLDFGEVGLDIDGVRVGDDAVILGMPREGGFLSMTLKNQYNQIVARTIEYGSTEPEELNYSTEKLDPTHYTWVKSRRPTFGGNERKARNRSFKRGAVIPPNVKNNRFTSVGEIQRVRKADDWENIGLEKKGAPSTKVLKAIAKYFTVSGVRLDPEEKSVHLQGWKPTFGTVKNASKDTLMTSGVNWEPNIWEGQRVRIVKGKLKGETFAVNKSTPNSIKIEGYSLPGNKKLDVEAGDVFSVGPGYVTPLFYTRKSGESAEWEWQNKDVDKNASYALYLFGLNDSIETTEFLEENFNAKLEVHVYNFKKNEYDKLPLLSKDSQDSDDPYKLVGNPNRLQYDKTDGIYCGMITPNHISSKNGIRLRLTAHNLDNKNCSGFAWFDYAYLAPGIVNGKINVNTASKQTLSSLVGITPKLVSNIAAGRGRNSKDQLKPYKNITDILEVEGMTPDIFSKNCNMITVRSDQYSIRILAEAINDVNEDGKFTPADGDKVLAQSRLNSVVDRSELITDTEYGIFHIGAEQ